MKLFILRAVLSILGIKFEDSNITIIKSEYSESITAYHGTVEANIFFEGYDLLLEVLKKGLSTKGDVEGDVIGKKIIFCDLNDFQTLDRELVIPEGYKLCGVN